MTYHVFSHDDCIVDHHTYCQCQGRQGNHIECLTKGLHHCKGCQQCYRDSPCYNHGCPKCSHKEKEHCHGKYRACDQVLKERIAGLDNYVGLIVELFYKCAGGQEALEVLHFPVDPTDHIYCTGIRLFEDDKGNRRHAVAVNRIMPGNASGPHCSYIPDKNRPGSVPDDRNCQQVFNSPDPAVTPDQVLTLPPDYKTGSSYLVVSGQCG